MWIFPKCEFLNIFLNMNFSLTFFNNYIKKEWKMSEEYFKDLQFLISEFAGEYKKKELYFWDILQHKSTSDYITFTSLIDDKKYYLKLISYDPEHFKNIFVYNCFLYNLE